MYPQCKDDFLANSRKTSRPRPHRQESTEGPETSSGPIRQEASHRSLDTPQARPFQERLHCECIDSDVRPSFEVTNRAGGPPRTFPRRVEDLRHSHDEADSRPEQREKSSSPGLFRGQHRQDDTQGIDEDVRKSTDEHEDRTKAEREREGSMARLAYHPPREYRRIVADMWQKVFLETPPPHLCENDV